MSSFPARWHADIRKWLMAWPWAQRAGVVCLIAPRAGREGRGGGDLVIHQGCGSRCCLGVLSKYTSRQADVVFNVSLYCVRRRADWPWDVCFFSTLLVVFVFFCSCGRAAGGRLLWSIFAEDEIEERLSCEGITSQADNSWDTYAINFLAFCSRRSVVLVRLRVLIVGMREVMLTSDGWWCFDIRRHITCARLA
jgi:hypothetical protein